MKDLFLQPSHKNCTSAQYSSKCTAVISQPQYSSVQYGSFGGGPGLRDHRAGVLCFYCSDLNHRIDPDQSQVQETQREEKTTGHRRFSVMGKSTKITETDQEVMQYYDS